MKIRDIYITCENGLEAVTPLAVQGVSEMMACFPKYEKMYPVSNLKNWQSDNALAIRNGQTFLEPYESVRWYIERAKLQAKLDNRYERGQICLNTLMNDLANDPYRQKIPQLSILLVKHDLYARQSDNTLLNYALGIGSENGFCVVSTARFLDENGYLKQEEFKTVLMHEFGHVIGLTPSNRRNSEENLGTHCLDESCIMQQRANGDFRDVTQMRLAMKQNDLAPICDDCIEAGNRYFEHDLARTITLQNLNRLNYGR